MINLKFFFIYFGGTAFGKNIKNMMQVEVFVKILLFLSAPIIARLYTPDDFGRFSLFLAILSTMASVSTARFEWLVPNERKKGALELIKLSVIFIACWSVMCIVGISFFTIAEFSIIETSGLGKLIYFLPIVMIAMGLESIYSSWYVKLGNLSNIAYVKLRQNILNITLTITAGVCSLGLSGLIYTLLVSSWFGILLFFLKTKLPKFKFQKIFTPRLFQVFNRNKSQAFLSSIVSIINSFIFAIPVFLIGLYYSSQELGWYTMMWRLAMSPIGVLSKSIGQSFWSESATLARCGEYKRLRELYLQTTIQLSFLSLPIVIICALAPLVIGPILGEANWGGAGYILMAMAPGLMATLIFSPTNHLVVYNSQMYQLITDVAVVMLIAISVLLSNEYNLSIIICTLLISSSVAMGYIARFLIHLKINLRMQSGL